MIFRIVMCYVLVLQPCFGAVKAVLFDCDGTLVDSEYAHYLCWNKALHDLGSDLSHEEYFHYVGNSEATVAALLSQERGYNSSDALLMAKMNYYRELCKAGIPPIEPTVDFLKRLAQEKEARGIKIGVCSASSKQTIISHLKHLKIDHLIDLVLSGREDLGEYVDPEGVNKPKPYIYIHAMKELNVSPKESVVIEDSSPGVTAGVRARCYTIAIPNEYTKRQDLSQAHWTLDSFSNMDVDTFLKKVAKVGE